MSADKSEIKTENTDNYTTLSMLNTTATGFQNPNYYDSYEIDKPTLDSNQNQVIINSIESKEINGPEEIKMQYSRKTNTLSLQQDVDIVICGRVYSIKSRTYLNFKKSLQMLKPFGVLIILIFVLIVLFRVEVLVQTGNQSE